MRCVSVETMRCLERACISGGVSGYELMSRAGRAAAAIITRRFPHAQRAVILVGGGNNGGDALVVAANLTIPVVVYACAPLEKLKNEAALAVKDLPTDIRVENRVKFSAVDFRGGDVIIDGLLGIGFGGGELREPYASAVAVVNCSRLPVVALDLPSGLNGDTGIASPSGAIKAGLTITFGYPKRGMVSGDGVECCGEILVAPIGLENSAPVPNDQPNLYTFADAVAEFPHPRFDCHKNSRGRLFIASGSTDYPGAASLNARAALRCNCGIVRLCTPKKSPNLPDAVVGCEISLNGVLPADLPERVADWLDNSDAVVAGSGWSARVSPELLSRLLRVKLPLVLDADALNLLAAYPRLWHARDNVIMTPHLGEAQRLATAFDVRFSSDRVEFTLALAKKFQCVVVLKGPRTVIANGNGEYSLNGSGNAKLATAGSGDVLSGAIGAFLASGMPPFAAARLGVYCHGLAGDLGKFGLIADDLPELLATACEAIATNCPR